MSLCMKTQRVGGGPHMPINASVGAIVHGALLTARRNWSLVEILRRKASCSSGARSLVLTSNTTLTMPSSNLLVAAVLRQTMTKRLLGVLENTAAGNNKHVRGAPSQRQAVRSC